MEIEKIISFNDQYGVLRSDAVYRVSLHRESSDDIFIIFVFITKI